jgi:hypothetical protein
MKNGNTIAEFKQRKAFCVATALIVFFALSGSESESVSAFFDPDSDPDPD